jgi:uncharacterized protein
MHRFLCRALAILALCVCALAKLPAQDATENFVKSHYTKYEFRIPMRDGKRLFTSVYVPKTGAFADAGPYPFLMDRTPYSVAPYGEDQYPAHLGPSDEFEKGGYIFVYQDVRGRWMSEGEFVEMRPHIDDKKGPQDVDDASDTYDTIEFLLKNVAGNNGKVGIWGISYPGFYTSASMIDSHPALVAASPQAPMTDLFKGDDAYHGGDFMLEANFGFYVFFLPAHNPEDPAHAQRSNFDFGTPDHYQFYLKAGNLADMEAKYLKGSNWLYNDQFQHDTYDAYWKARNLAPHMKNVKCAVLVVGGWYDAEDLAGPYGTFYAVNKFNPETPTTLVEGPWVHGGWARGDGSHLGDAQFNAKTAEYFRANIQFPFFEHYLKGKSAGAQPKAVVFETGTNVWRNFDSWPPKAAQPKTLYFHANGKLSFNPPAEAKGTDEYVSDPNHPVPFVGYTTDTVPQRYMVDDQRFASYRPDVLVYQTEPLEEDVTIAGPISPKLKIASSGTDSDFIVKLIDVYPDDAPDVEGTGSGNKRILDSAPLHMGGYQQLLRGEPFRAKFRNSWEKPEALTPGKQTEIDYTMPDLFHTFRRGHRIMVQLQSTWFPLTDRNPQTFTDIPHAKPEDFVKATEQVFHQKDAASGVEVLVMP